MNAKPAARFAGIVAQHITQRAVLVMFVCGAPLCLFAQGTIDFNNHVPGVVVTHVYAPDINDFLGQPLTGNSSADTPSGTQDYFGMPLVGSCGANCPYGGARIYAALRAAPGANMPESSLTFGVGTTTFRTGTAAGWVVPVEAVFNNIPPDAPVATVQMFAWDAGSSGITDPVVAYGHRHDETSSTTTWSSGVSPTFNVTNIGSAVNPPARLTGLQSFSLYVGTLMWSHLTTTVNGGGVVMRAPDHSYFPSGNTFPYLPNGTEVTLTALANAGWVFSNWSGDTNGTQNPLTLSVYNDLYTNIVANFTAVGPGCAAPSGLVSWWPGAGNAQDIVGFNNGTLQNGATFAAGEVGQAFSFDGVDDYVSITNTASMDFGTGDFSIDLWLKLNSLASDQELIHKVVGTVPNDYTYFLEFDTPNVLRFMVRGTSANQNDLMATTSMSAGQWYHVAAVRSGNTNNLYLNGALIGWQTAGSSVDTGSGGAASLGKLSPNGTGVNRFLNGSLDEIDLFNRALTASEIQAIYNAGSTGKCVSPIYITSVNHSGTNMNLSWLAQKGMSYRTQYKTNVTEATWHDLSNDVTATRHVAVTNDVTWGSATQRFYRVKLLP